MHRFSLRTTPGPIRAFTILELMIVVTILALLAGILAPTLEDDANIAKDARRATDLRAVAATLAHYYKEHGSYPSTNGEWHGDAANYGSYGYDAAGYIPNLVPNYLPYLPKDPDPNYPDSGAAGYMYRSDGYDFKFVINTTPSTYYVSNPFYDPVRPTQGWQVSSPGEYQW